MLATGLAVGLEPSPGTGPSPASRSDAHDRVCSCSFTSTTTHGPCLWLCSSTGGFHMEGWSLLRPGFHAPIRRDPPLSRKPGASCPRAASRNRWQPARGVCGQHPQLSSLPSARAVPVAGQHHQEAAPGQCAVQMGSENGLSSAPSIVSPPPLSRAQRAHTRLSWHERLARNARVSPVSADDDQTVRRPRSLCRLTRFRCGLTLSPSSHPISESSLVRVDHGVFR